MTFSLDIIQTTLVKKTRPGVVRVYDYYDPGKDIIFTLLSFWPLNLQYIKRQTVQLPKKNRFHKYQCVWVCPNRHQTLLVPITIKCGSCQMCFKSSTNYANLITYLPRLFHLYNNCHVTFLTVSVFPNLPCQLFVQEKPVHPAKTCDFRQNVD
jgi:hypothetical protein